MGQDPSTSADRPPPPAESERPADTQRRKQRVLTQGLPSLTRAIADATVLKDGDLFLMTEPDGRLPPDASHGLGLYYHDCRYLRTYELQLNGVAPIALGGTTEAGNRGLVQLTNPELGHTKDPLPRDALSIEWDRTLNAGELTLVDRLTLRNWRHTAVELALQIRLDAGFEDVFEIRGLLNANLGTAEAPAWDGHRLCFLYHGRDGRERSVAVEFPPEFASRESTGAKAMLRLDPRQERTLELRVEIREWERKAGTHPDGRDDRAPHDVTGGPLAPRRWPDATTFTSDTPALDDVLARSFADLGLLRSTLRGRTFIAAGIPWFATLFGRDSLVAALQLLPYAPEVARDTLRLLASYQAEQLDEWRDAAPGKILHELRVGEMARTGAIPHSPYYGSVDATPLFLLVLGQYVAWTGDLALFDELGEHVRRALEWIDRYGDTDGDGYVEYRSVSEHGLINQGWKDSGDAIVDEHGCIATPPIALVEVQAYVYAAKLAIAELSGRRGDAATEARLRQEARDLRQRFDRDFWVDALGCYAMALEARKQPLLVVSSNAGHALWCGIAEPSRAAKVAERLMAEDMFSGWGVRTLSERCAGYNPVAYHLGTVWPHDNAFVAAGLKRYGFGAHAQRVFEGLASAARDFDHRRLPELWTGFSRQRYASPIRYPVACHPQAWAAGSIPFLLQHLLGLEADALEHRLWITEPIMPGPGAWIELRNVRVGDAAVDLRFERAGARSENAARVDVLAVRGRLAVEIGPRTRRQRSAAS